MIARLSRSSVTSVSHIELKHNAGNGISGDLNDTLERHLDAEWSIWPNQELCTVLKHS